MTTPLQGQGTGPMPAGPTVGDTIWVARTVAVPPGTTVRPTDWDPPDPIQRLGAPRLVPHGDSTDVAYPIVIWRAGPITVDVPGPLLLSPGGRIDSVPPRPQELRIASVLPAAIPPESLAPQPRADFVPRTTVSAIPLLILLLVAVLLLAPLHWWWRRRGTSRPRPALTLLREAPPPLDRWSDAGESRAVAAIAARRLRSVIATRMPAAHTGLDTEDLLRVTSRRGDWPLAQLADLLHALDEARFGHATVADAVGLARRADELAPRLTPEAA
ncbi:MAG TPA: hypothetical protein VFN08_16990 [Gemmatimonadales bacterium]|jgi:hypothetical protein|nr:hypothetical protein [Gemmatimonadales bacterium]